MSDIIQIRELTKFYGKTLAVDHISFDVKEGEVFGFLGPNGAGKTSTIRMMVGLTQPSSGTALINGHDVLMEPVEVKKTIGLVPETSNLYGELTTLKNIIYQAELYGVPKNERSIHALNLLEEFNLKEHQGKPFQSLSRGLKRRLTIAAALVHKPNKLFLDEPTTGLDVMSARGLRKLIKDLKKKRVTIFLTTHYIPEAENLCDRIAVIVKGKIMENYKIRYKNSKFSNEKVELDGKSFAHCEFENCIIILEKGEAEVSGSSFKNCKLMLRGNAYTVGKIIKLFTGKSPLKVLDMEEPLFEKMGSGIQNQEI